MSAMTNDEITAAAIEQALREVPEPTREQAHDAVAAEIAMLANSYWGGACGEDTLITIRRLEHAARLLRQDETEITRLREIERCARAFIIEIGREPGDVRDVADAENALRAACFPETAGKRQENADG